MADQWYVNRYTPAGPQQLGPLPFDDVRQMAASGQLAPTDAVFRQGSENWVPASSVPALYSVIQSAGPMAPPAPAPYAGPGYSYSPPRSSSSSTVLWIVLAVCVGGGGLLFVGCLVAITMIGSNASSTFSTVGNKLAVSTSPATPTRYSRDAFRNLVNNKTKDQVLLEMGAPDRKENELQFNEMWIYEDKLADFTTAKVQFRGNRVSQITFE
jgi:hypothetical protein